MSEAPWLTIIGLGEDGPDGLSPASRAALERAEIVMGPPRHLSLLPDLAAERIDWPVPFADGVQQLMALRGRPVCVLASGDPFWFGAGSVLAGRLSPGEWRALPGLSSFALAASRLGWALDRTGCYGLHAAPLSRLRPSLAPEARMIVLLRDGAAVAELADLICDAGFGASRMVVMEALGGPRERITEAVAHALPATGFAHPVCAALEIAGDGAVLPLASGRPDSWFDSDGTMTKQPVRALTLSALAPRPGEHLWDIGGGSGSIAIEWLLSHASLRATCIEPRPDRLARIRANADRLGADRLQLVEGAAPAALEGLEAPDVVFVGGGLSQALLERLATLPAGTRIVANAVTLESEALLTQAQATLGGELMRIEIARATPLGPRRGWSAAYPVVTWSTVL
ncbi:bifunctional cobalt-precorrin-7 (C(5))-methyltransferase/cobalt-precorrin-6B (C(15))-methyltransferase [Pseudoponticoccus marisrubri]|uniref:Precorrin-6Y methyltransferase n=1 Tax=Pseudoponticoccus marisrubri TaxID=1685382 RepID=A0A0W7WPH3_9RHOB|nr:bifunctional cobalt-precorrin-7 (C(5))-methyltransferase/cobalt-precorrin-6B (C(15))-methyltransferase [Pseudoponticoccus marisrubri]KUF12433.1 precorrin-6Y methyltransferase [Pseudoponticoccus marisrubri]